MNQDLALSFIESILPLVSFLFVLLIPIMIVIRLFRFKDVIVRLVDEARKNPDMFKNNPEALRSVLTQLQRAKKEGRSSSSGLSSKQRQRVPASTRSSTNVSHSRRGGVLNAGRDLRSSSSTNTRRASAVRGTARMTQIRAEQKLKTTVAVLLLLAGVVLLFSNYFYEYHYESFYSGIAMMVAGLYLLKTDVERV
ncbi:MAG: hypothetical protein KDI90_06330 [Alphaproteobacteria bacterium]|nr:hypothetical protein [Alphaproteobacteria bacterium]MCB9974569.1 hypothetical protein [Rhodospirillales bacterium]